MSSIPSHETNVKFDFTDAKLTDYCASLLQRIECPACADCYAKLSHWSTLFYKKYGLRMIIRPAVRNYTVLTHISYHCQMKCNKRSVVLCNPPILNGYIVRTL